MKLNAAKGGIAIPQSTFVVGTTGSTLADFAQHLEAILGINTDPTTGGTPGVTISEGPEPPAALLQNTGACAAWQNGHEWRALRGKRHTYATYRVDRSELLFDNVKDPYQLKDIAAAQPAIVKTLTETHLTPWLKRTNDPWAKT